MYTRTERITPFVNMEVSLMMKSLTNTPSLQFFLGSFCISVRRLPRCEFSFVCVLGQDSWNCALLEPQPTVDRSSCAIEVPRTFRVQSKRSPSFSGHVIVVEIQLSRCFEVFAHDFLVTFWSHPLQIWKPNGASQSNINVCKQKNVDRQ